jgi:uncharacterized protein YecE (DUF72 family)
MGIIGGAVLEVFIGTSGWAYSWNEGGTLEWYQQATGFPAIELNMSFYRFPFPNQVKSWARRGAGLRWCVKVHRLITHRYRFNDNAIAAWPRFAGLYAPLDPLIDFFLFQAPPGFTNVERLQKFVASLGLGERCALELRNKELLGDDAACHTLQQNATLVSVDSPDFEERIFPGKYVYLRIHGRGSWYDYDYSREELVRLADAIRRINPDRTYIFFNNDTAMLQNALEMQEILGSARSS